MLASPITPEKHHLNPNPPTHILTITLPSDDYSWSKVTAADMHLVAARRTTLVR
jgi:hypothetical protein